MIRAESDKPREYLRNFDKYASLVNRQAEEDVKQFLTEPHSFQEIMAEVIHYQQLVNQIQYTPCKVPDMFPLLLHLSEVEMSSITSAPKGSEAGVHLHI